MNLISKNENMPGGLMDYEVGQVFDQLIDLTDQPIRWDKVQTALDAATFSYVTREIDGFRVDLSMVNGDIDAKITEFNNPDDSGRVVGMVTATHPPELHLRAELAGKAFTLYKLAEAHNTES
jgi:hypothetical protein